MALTLPLAAGCASTATPGGGQAPAGAAPSTAGSPDASAAPQPSGTPDLQVPPPRSCHLAAGSSAAQSLPDPRCTPGLTNPAVSPQNLEDTICKPGWTRTVRPPASVTDRLKQQLMQSYGESGSPRLYELDHLIPLELGGAPLDVRNLWPQPGPSPNPKDDVERRLNLQVCAGKLGLKEAQRRIAADWTRA